MEQVHDPRLEVTDGSRAIHVIATWGGTVLLVRHLKLPPRRTSIAARGLLPGGIALTLGGALLLPWQAGLGALLLLLGVALAMGGSLLRRGKPRLTVGSAAEADLHLDDPVLPGPCVPLVEVRGGRFYVLGQELAAADASRRLQLGGLSLEITSVPPARELWVSPFPSVERSDLRFTGGSLLAHVVVLLFVLAIPPAASALRERETFDADRAIITTSRPRPLVQRAVPLWLTQGGQGRRAVGLQGRMGNPLDRHASGLFTLGGPRDNARPRISREPTLPPVSPRKGIGLINLAAVSAGQELAAQVGERIPSIVGGSEALGREAKDALGGLVGQWRGDAYGVGGLGIVGIGRGGGGNAETIGLDTLDTKGLGCAGGQGVGYCARMGHIEEHRAGVPRLVLCEHSRPRGQGGCVAIKGELGKAIIRRVVRRHITEVRYCYARELQARPGLHGRVVVRFVITGAGTVASSTTEASTLDSARVERCVTRAVRRWRFPSSDHANITIVSYPFVFQAVP